VCENVQLCFSFNITLTFTFWDFESNFSCIDFLPHTYSVYHNFHKNKNKCSKEEPSVEMIEMWGDIISSRVKNTGALTSPAGDMSPSNRS
jgi:hypothetical protein